jgi:hypothetical protein
MAVVATAAVLLLSVVGANLLSIASAATLTATLNISGTPKTGGNTYGVTLVVPAMGDPAPTGNVVVADGTSNCSASLSAPAGDGVTYTGSCTIASEHAGATVTASYAADANYDAATSANSLTIAKTDQSALTITTTTASFNSPLTLKTSGGSDAGAVTYAITDPGSAVCSISSGVLTETSAGTCTVTATMAANTDFNPVSSAATTITISPIAQAALTITTTSASFNSLLTLATSGGSDSGTVTYVVVGGGSAGCSVSGGVLSENSAGTCSVTATMAGNTNFSPVSSAATTITIGKINQVALTILTTSGSWNTPLTLGVSGGTDSGTVTYSVNGAGTAGCAVAGGVLAATGAGTCSVTATMAGNTDYNPVSSGSTTITIGKINQSGLTITSTSGTYKTPLALAVSGGSDNGSVSYSVDNAGSAGCSVSSGVVTETSAGTCTVTATMAGNGNYNAVSSSSTTITIAKTGQAGLTITSTSGIYSSPLTLAVSGGSDGAAVSYTLDAAGSAGCSISGNSLSATGAGTCTVTATMAANADFNAVSSSATTITISRVAVAAAISSLSIAHFTTLSPGSFTFQVGGTPSPVLRASGKLPAGLSLVNNGNGTATIRGFTALLALGTHHVTLVATNGVGGRAARSLNIVVGFAPVVITEPGATFTAGSQNRVVVASLGDPTSSLSESGNLPKGVTFASTSNGTATIAGRPSPGTHGSFDVALTARNSFGVSHQSFTLVVGAVPRFSSSNFASFPIGVSTVVRIAAGGNPQPTISEHGTLPIGVHFRAGRGTGYLSGTAAKGTSGGYHVTFTARSSTGLSTTQTFTLVVGSVPTFSSRSSTTFVVGDATVFIVSAKGSPSPAVAERGTLPSGIRFQGGSGTGILSGTPAKGTSGTYRVTLTAGKGSTASAQTFTLVVSG